MDWSVAPSITVFAAPQRGYRPSELGSVRRSRRTRLVGHRRPQPRSWCSGTTKGTSRQAALDLFDAFGSKEKSLHANLGGHTGVPRSEMETGLGSSPGT